MITARQVLVCKTCTLSSKTAVLCGVSGVLTSSVMGTAFLEISLAPGAMMPRVMSFAMGSACSSTCCVAFCGTHKKHHQQCRNPELLAFFGLPLFRFPYFHTKVPIQLVLASIRLTAASQSQGMLQKG